MVLTSHHGGMALRLCFTMPVSLSEVSSRKLRTRKPKGGMQEGLFLNRRSVESHNKLRCNGWSGYERMRAYKVADKINLVWLKDGSPQIAYMLVTGDVRKAPEQSRKAEWCTGSSFFRTESRADP